VGAPLLYGTSNYFLEHFGLKSVNELPRPGELKQT
jgi:chromosome segregation and condensation protein ScpB